MTVLNTLRNAAASELAIALNHASPPDHSKIDPVHLLEYVHAQAQYALAYHMGQTNHRPPPHPALPTKPSRGRRPKSPEPPA